MARDTLHLAVDLTPLLPGGENGGIKPFIFEAIPWLRNHFAGRLRFTFLTSSVSHAQVRSVLAGPLDSLICINRNSPGHFMEFQGRGERDFFWKNPPGDFLWRLGVDVLYCPFGAAGRHCPGIPVVATVVDLLHLDYPDTLDPREIAHRESYFRKMVSAVDVFQCVSDYVTGRLAAAYGVAAERIFRTHLVVADRLKGAGVTNAGPAAPFFFYPANFWPHKNHLTLLVAYAHYVSRSGANAWDLVLTGYDSPEARAVLAHAKTLGLSDRVRYEGHVSEQRLGGLWANAAALVFPSLHEGFGIPLVEAMAYRLPIICGETTSLREVAGDAAVFVDASNPLSLAEGLLRVAGDEGIRQGLSEKAAARFKVFSFDQEMQKLADTFRGFLSGSPVRSTIKGIGEDGAMAPETVFSHRHRGRVFVGAVFQTDHAPARVRLRCGDRMSGSWSLPGDAETAIEAAVFCDGAPCVWEIMPDRGWDAGNPRVVCRSLEVWSHKGEPKETLLAP